MADLKDDIAKYLRGELGPTEMHALEKKALNDPFVAEALEGANSLPVKDFLTDVTELDDRLAGKQNTKETWLSPWRIAATVALLLSVSYVVYIRVKPDERITLAQKVPEAPTQGPVSADSIPKSSAEKPENNLLSLNRKRDDLPRRKPGEEESKPRLTTPAPATKTVATTEGKAGQGDLLSEAVTKDADLAAAKADESRAAGTDDKIASIEVESNAKKKEVAPPAAFHFDASGVAAVAPVQNVISGKVTATEDNSPLPGVNVVIKGTARGAVSDVNGFFKLVTDASANDLVFSFIGYESAEVKLSAGQTEANVQLSIDATQLSEVVVVGYGAAKKEDDSETPVPITLAEPLGGKRAYKKYLDNNLQYPSVALDNKIEGKVTLEFVVQTDGALSDFSVLHGLGFGCNDEVIRLVKEGPRWKPSRQGDVPLESQVRIRVRFKLPK